MVKARGEEIWAAACIEAALPKVKVSHHDDGSQQSMHDFDLIRDGVAVGACEVTAAADPQLIELWNLVNGRKERHLEPGLRGGWILSLKPQCRVKKLKGGLRQFLENLEARQISDAGRLATPPDVEESMDALGIDHLAQSGTEFVGSVYFTVYQAPEMTGGFVPETGDPLCEWLEGWIAEPAQKHNITKLAGSSSLEKHLFVLVPSFSKAPFVAADALMRDDGPLPTRPPRLPEGLTHLWVMSMWSSGNVFAWSPAGDWTRYEKVATIPGGLAARS